MFNWPILTEFLHSKVTQYLTANRFFFSVFVSFLWFNIRCNYWVKFGCKSTHFGQKVRPGFRSFLLFPDSQFDTRWTGFEDFEYTSNAKNSKKKAKLIYINDFQIAVFK
jgi:hypothetical protein